MKPNKGLLEILEGDIWSLDITIHYIFETLHRYLDLTGHRRDTFTKKIYILFDFSLFFT